MKELNCDFHIVGSALTGLLTAYSLQKQGYEIIISEKKLFNLRAVLKDSRTTAVAEGSKVYLDQIGLWKKLKPFAEPIKLIEVIDQTAKSKIKFNNFIKNTNLGYIIKNSILINILLNDLKQKKNVKFLFQTEIKRISYNKSKIVSHSKGFKVSSNLLIASDGKQSSVRKIMKTKRFVKKYNEKAIVINFCHKKPHNNVAYEFFYKSGPLAILPMQKEKNSFQSALIWSNKAKIIDFFNSSKINQEYIIEILNEKLSSNIGKVKKINSKQTFPLSAHINERFYEERLVYVGDAAHSIHPIAGQGWNLGIRDIRSLSNLIKKNADMKKNLDAKKLCKSYNDECYFDAYRLYQITDKLDWAFKKNQTHFRFLRSIGFSIINKNPSIKKRIVNFAMGI
tara:strand:+ start:29262 stop:30446 length:1185 start_codon:yes stop_codon:yes gene_type:complete